MSRHGVGQHRLLEAYGGRERLAVQLGVVDGDGGPAGHVLGEGEVVLGVVPAGLGGHPGHHAEHPPVRDQRHHDGAAQLEVEGDPHVLLVPRAGDQHLVGDLRDQLGAAGAQHVPGPPRRVRVAGVALLQGPGQLHLLGVDVGDRNALQAVVLDDVDGAPVRERRDHQGRHLRQGLAVVEAAGQLGRGVREEGQPLVAAGPRRPGPRSAPPPGRSCRRGSRGTPAPRRRSSAPRGRTGRWRRCVRLADVERQAQHRSLAAVRHGRGSAPRWRPCR